MKKAITILSGGLDSMVSTAIARKKHNIVLALTFDYGQRAVRREIAAAGKLCGLWKIEHKVIELPWLKEITDTALVNKGLKLPAFKIEVKRKKEKGRSAKAVWVPNRNALFINIAASFAQSLGVEVMVTGFNKEEGATFPDNSGKFVQIINKTIKLSTIKGLKAVKVVSFVQKMDKKGMVRYSLDHDLPIELCWPCYEGGDTLCGRCESCVRFFNAIDNC